MLFLKNLLTGYSHILPAPHRGSPQGYLDVIGENF